MLLQLSQMASIIILPHVSSMCIDDFSNLNFHFPHISGGFYTIEQKEKKLRLIALNTNLFSGSAGSEEDPGGQWQWLESVLAKSTKNKETVFI